MVYGIFDIWQCWSEDDDTTWQWNKIPQNPKSELFFYFKSDYDELFHQMLEHDREMNRPFAHKPTFILELRICDYGYSLPSGQTWYLPLQCTNHTIFIYFFHICSFALVSTGTQID
jgi:hypothetical protein